MDPITEDFRRSNEQIERMIAEYQRKAAGRPRLLTPLPRRTRLRLAIHRHVTSAGCWLGDHVSWTATERLWRAAGLLGRKRG